ncbi:MAG: ribosome assembly RNA-binding protein YhbY [Bacillota bacterium]|nr:ribosome assembly RNA-binding protein YhbY [Bacillota bacterium]HOB90354.1 ribosome assembly RNA-binding protein YhbY [Bacillota bacterium]HPZ53906.1 ribosome assembly RNA-binding protein YhbY [Bacillota bacterium]HQD17415.1 ribosome assembly RNA-binding protein YhbY [Bacillota bacterium]
MLTSKQRAYLRKIGHQMDPIIQIGKSGVTEPVIRQVDEALEARELIKARVLQSCTDSIESIAEQLVKATGAEVVQSIGNILLFYRRSSKHPTIELD